MDTYRRVKLTKLIYSDKSAPSNTAVIPIELFPEIRYNIKTKLKFGLKEVDIKFIPGMRNGPVKLSQDIFNMLNLYENMQAGAKLENGKLKLGPVMGVFMNENAVRRLYNGNPTEKMAEMANAAKSTGVLVYFFTIGDVLWAENMVNGVLFKQETDTWERRKMPFPDVLYDRGGGFSAESLAIARKLRSQLDNLPGLKKINFQHYFDKWDMHCKLSKHEEMNIYLPETISHHNNLADFKRMIDNHSTVYLKMCTGSNGKGVIRVRKQGSSQYEYSYFKDTIVQGSVRTLDELVAIATNLMGNRDFIIQQGIDVLTYADNKVDLRVLVQRNRRGEWQITSMPVRIAVNDCAVTSTKSGSKVYTFDHAFNNILKFSQLQVESFKSGINSLIFTAVNTLEKEYGRFGELGIDVAIDKNGKLWFIESNAKPAKDTILIAGPRADIENSFRLPFEYCKYLTGF